MNIYTNLLFLQGHLADPHLFDDEERYAPEYGNRAASAKFFAPLGHARRTGGQADAADTCSAARTNAECFVGGCA